MTPIVIMLVGMLVFMFLGVPLAFSILGISTLVFVTFTDISFWQIVQRFFSGIDSFVLTAIPFFLLAGNLMNEGKISDRLVDLASALVGHIRGGLAQINVLDSLFFGGISGSAVADTSGIGSMIIPQMIRKGYTPEFTVAITATTSVLGQIIQSLVGVGNLNAQPGADFFDAVADDLAEGLLDVAADDEHDLVETGFDGVVDGVVHQDLAVGAHGGKLFDAAAVAGADSGGHNNQCSFHVEIPPKYWRPEMPKPPDTEKTPRGAPDAFC